MAQDSVLIEKMRRDSLRLFRQLAKGRGRGVMECTFFGVAQPESSRRDIYHSIVDKSGDPTSGIATYCYIEMDAPIKVVKELGWWREGDTIPILMFLPYEATYTPEKACRIVVSGHGYMDGNWNVNQVKAFGQDIPVAWVCTVTPKRSTN